MTSLNCNCGSLIESEGDGNVAIAVSYSIILFEIRRGEFTSPDNVVIAMVRELDRESIGLGFDLHLPASLPSRQLASVVFMDKEHTFRELG